MRFPVAVLDDLAASNAESLTSRVVWTTSGRKLTIGPSIATHKGNINANTIQTKAIAKALELLGDEAWSYGYKSGQRCNDIKHILEEVRTACGYQVKYRTFLRWFQHFLKFGECPAATSRRRRRHVVEEGMQHPSPHTTMPNWIESSRTSHIYIWMRSRRKWQRVVTARFGTPRLYGGK